MANHHQLGRVKTTDIYSLEVLEAQSLKSRSQQAQVLSESSERKGSLLASSDGSVRSLMF